MNFNGYMYIYLCHLVTASQQLELFLLTKRTDNFYKIHNNESNSISSTLDFSRRVYAIFYNLLSIKWLWASHSVINLLIIHFPRGPNSGLAADGSRV